MVIRTLRSEDSDGQSSAAAAELENTTHTACRWLCLHCWWIIKWLMVKIPHKTKTTCVSTARAQNQLLQSPESLFLPTPLAVWAISYKTHDSWSMGGGQHNQIWLVNSIYSWRGGQERNAKLTGRRFVTQPAKCLQSWRVAAQPTASWVIQGLKTETIDDRPVASMPLYGLGQAGDRLDTGLITCLISWGQQLLHPLCHSRV